MGGPDASLSSHGCKGQVLGRPMSWYLVTYVRGCKSVFKRREGVLVLLGHVLPFPSFIVCSASNEGGWTGLGWFEMKGRTLWGEGKTF